MTYGYGSSEEHQPLVWVRGIPFYAVHVVVSLLVLSMIATSILRFAGGTLFLDALIFESGRVLGGEVWRVITYGLVNEPTLGFAIDMVMLVWFGRELEKLFGRRVFLWLYAGLYLTTPLLFTLAGGFGWRGALAGHSGGLALFVAFAVVYPNVPLLFNLLAKWVAIILVALYTLSALSQRNGMSLLSLWGTVGFAIVFVLNAQGRIAWPSLSRPKPASTGRKIRPAEVISAKTVSTSSTGGTSMAEVDALLDKIAQSGISSLTAKERARLEAAHKHLKGRGTRPTRD